MLDGYPNAREWRIWTRGGARWEKQCRFGGGMLRLWNVECWIWNGACGTGIFLPRISDRHRCHSDCLSITQITPPARQIDADLFAGGEGFIMWSVENVECGIWSVERVPLDVEWVYNGEHGAKRLCLYGAKSDNGIKKMSANGVFGTQEILSLLQKSRTDHRAAR